MNYIILEKSSSLRAKARKDLKGKWLFAIGVMIIANICTVVIPTLIQSLTDIKVYFFGLDSIFMHLVSGPINLGIALYFLGSRRGKSKSPLAVFEGFRKYFKVLGLYICIMVIVLLWSFLMVVPGIIAAFRYSMAYNILVDHPEYTIKQCLDESKRIMDGNIGKLFLLNLSFIGWGLLVSAAILVMIKFTPLPMTDAFKLADYMYINEMASLMDIGMAGVASLQWLTLLIGMLLISPLIAYVQAANCVFYEILIGNVEGKGVMSDVYDAMSIVEREEFIKNM